MDFGRSMCETHINPLTFFTSSFCSKYSVRLVECVYVFVSCVAIIHGETDIIHTVGMFVRNCRHYCEVLNDIRYIRLCSMCRLQNIAWY